MSIQRLTLFCSLSLSMALATSAQSVTFRGKVEDVPGMAGQYFVDCTDVSLTSASVTLQTFVGQQVEIVGDWNGSSIDPSVEVTAITAALEDFEIGGSGKIGESASIKVIGTPGNTFLTFGGLAPGFFPLASAGAVLIDPASAEILGSGTIPALGQLETNATVPNEVSLIGLVYHAQALVRDAATGDYSLTVTDCIEFLAP